MATQTSTSTSDTSKRSSPSTQLDFKRLQIQTHKDLKNDRTCLESYIEDRVSGWLTKKSILPGDPASKQIEFYESAKQKVRNLQRSIRCKKLADPVQTSDSCAASQNIGITGCKLSLVLCVDSEGTPCKTDSTITPGSKSSNFSKRSSNFSSLLERRAAKNFACPSLSTNIGLNGL